MVSTTHYSPKLTSLKLAPSGGPVGRTYIQGQGESKESPVAWYSSWVNWWSHPSDDLPAQYNGQMTNTFITLNLQRL